jgi:hypothetical protein
MKVNINYNIFIFIISTNRTSFKKYKYINKVEL